MIFFALKNPTASAGFEPATPRPPKPQHTTIKGKLMYVEHNYLLLCMVDLNRLHVSTLHAGHVQAFT